MNQNQANSGNPLDSIEQENALDVIFRRLFIRFER